MDEAPERERGEAETREVESGGREADVERRAAPPSSSPAPEDLVDEADEESFPASDPPATTPLRAGPPKHEP